VWLKFSLVLNEQVFAALPQIMKSQFGWSEQAAQ
jgi:hypothetical protein